MGEGGTGEMIDFVIQSSLYGEKKDLSDKM
jgi:hypothetical protein